MELKQQPLNRSLSSNCIFRKVPPNKAKSSLKEDQGTSCKTVFKLNYSRRVINSAVGKVPSNEEKKSEPESRTTPINRKKLEKSCFSSNNLSRSRARDKSSSAKNENLRTSKKIQKFGFFKTIKGIKWGKNNEELLKALQKSNGFFTKNEGINRFKFYIAPGNNSELVVDIMKRRQMWKRIYCFKRAHFIWTPWLSFNVLPILHCVNKAENVNLSKNVLEDYSNIPENFCYEVSPKQELDMSKIKLYNKLPGNFELAWKKQLFYNMCGYYKKTNVDPFTRIPLTYHVKVGSYDSIFRVFYAKFMEFQRNDQPNIWIIKPGENTNRGFGIRVCSKIEEIIESVNDFSEEYGRTFIVQKYIEKPLLYLGRKFDIRCYALVTSFQGNTQAFFYKEGYIRTCCEKYNIKNVKNQFIHLTNDAIQKFSIGYGKFENANKLSYEQLQEYLETFDKNVNFFKDILPLMKQIVLDTVLATYEKLNPSKKIQCFEVLGYDFMIDSNYKPWLIEVNTNPCLELVSPYLEVLIPKMLENAFALTVDQFFKGNSFLKNGFEMVFNEASAGMNL
jgi:hypothetical protein